MAASGKRSVSRNQKFGANIGQPLFEDWCDHDDPLHIAPRYAA
jgi:hypothetical protein